MKCYNEMLGKWHNYNIEFDNEYKGDLVNKHIISFITNRLKNIKLWKIEHTIKITSYNSINITTEENLHGYAVIGLANHNKEHGDKSIKNFNYMLTEPRNIEIFFKEGEIKKPDWEWEDQNAETRMDKIRDEHKPVEREDSNLFKSMTDKFTEKMEDINGPEAYDLYY